MSMKILIFLFNIPQYKQSVCENLPRNTYTNIVSYWIKWHGLLLQSWRGVFRMCIIFQDVVPETFNLIEVLLDKGVNEQVLPSDARPWQILQKSRKVTHPILHSSLCLNNVTRDIFVYWNLKKLEWLRI